MTRVKILALLVGMILLFTLPAVVSAQVQLPHIFVGTVTLVDGTAAPDGTVVSAWVEGVTDAAGTGTTTGGSYKIVANPGEESWAGLTVTFLVDGSPAAESATFEHGGADVLNLTATSGAEQPTPTPVSAEVDLAAIAAEVVNELKNDSSFLRAVTGSDGSDGQDGAAGKDGANGPDGFAGPPGRKGSDGADGSAGTRGPSGDNGSSGVRGPAGSDGDNGSSGASGTAGDDASSALGIVALIVALMALGGAGGAFLLGRRS
jgi:hypothetical protein